MTSLESVSPFMSQLLCSPPYANCKCSASTVGCISTVVFGAAWMEKSAYLHLHNKETDTKRTESREGNALIHSCKESAVTLCLPLAARVALIHVRLVSLPAISPSCGRILGSYSETLCSLSLSMTIFEGYIDE